MSHDTESPRRILYRACAVQDVNEENLSHDDHKIIEAIGRLREQDDSRPDELTRRRHLRAIDKQLHPARRRSFAAVAAAVVLVIGAGIAFSTTSDESNPSLAADAEPLELKPVDSISSVPFDRTEDHVMITVDADRAEQVSGELASVLGAAAPVVGSDDSRTTFVVPASAASRLSDSSGLTVVADTPMQSIAEQTPVPSWGLDRIDAVDVALNNSYKYVSTGAGTLIYVIDTGVYAGHADLAGRVIPGYTAVADGNGTSDCNGHGTHVAGTAAGSTYGVAKSATIVAVRVLDCAGSGFSSSVVAGINWAIASHPGGPGIINLSLGGPANSAVDAAVADATAAGLIVVAAAGNSGADACQFSPARAASALTIGATDQSDARASYSNFGGCVDMYAPGSSITSAWISGATSTRSLSGTSMAAPHVAGMVARLKQAQPGISSGAVYQTLTASNVGTGTVSIANFVEQDAPVTTTTSPTTETTVVDSPNTTTTTVVRSTTTTAPRPGSSGNTPGQNKAPGRNKAVVQPKEFALGYTTMNDDRLALVASWIDDRTPESYSIECTALNARPDAVPTTRFLVEKGATVLSAAGRVESELLMAPAESLRCWVVAYIGNDKSAQSNPAVLVARPTARGRSSDSSVPTTSAPSTKPNAPAPTTPRPSQGGGNGKAPSR